MPYIETIIRCRAQRTSTSAFQGGTLVAPLIANNDRVNYSGHGAEDETGDRPLAERARWLRHAAVFVGLSSGLSWLAWSAGCPTVLISGFTHPTNEFTTPFRVINWHACNSCWNDPGVQFDHKDFMWCPRHGGTARQFECTRLITSLQVQDIIGTNKNGGFLTVARRKPQR